MPIGTHRITHATIAMFEEDGRHVARQVPVGAIIQVDGSFDGNRLTDVILDDQHVMMFTQDLRTRTEPVPDSK